VTLIGCDDFKLLFLKLGEYLYKEVNWGGYPGCQMSSEY